MSPASLCRRTSSASPVESPPSAARFLGEFDRAGDGAGIRASPKIVGDRGNGASRCFRLGRPLGPASVSFQFAVEELQTRHRRDPYSPCVMKKGAAGTATAASQVGTRAGASRRRRSTSRPACVRGRRTRFHCRDIGASDRARTWRIRWGQWPARAVSEPVRTGCR